MSSVYKNTIKIENKLYFLHFDWKPIVFHLQLLLSFDRSTGTQTVNAKVKETKMIHLSFWGCTHATWRYWRQVTLTVRKQDKGQHTYIRDPIEPVWHQTQCLGCLCVGLGGASTSKTQDMEEAAVERDGRVSRFTSGGHQSGKMPSHNKCGSNILFSQPSCL